MNGLQRLLPHPSLSALLVVLWLVIQDAVSVGLVLLGVIFAILIPLFAAPLFPVKRRRIAWRAVFALLRVFLVDLVIANVKVARIVLAPRLRAEPMFIAVPIELESPFAASALASIVTLTPGTLSVDVDLDEQVLWIHGLDVDDPEGVVAHIKKRYERPLRELFE
ncbi:MAG TPA: Na+/H+ antiporter subunit E [Steroidobacteraceae bacterium]|nr:Na+/H+ antiporter subunit E [Steroidobacteraceae bacterium]